ncbi:MAG: hypothetical protein QOD76_260 [Solirubrobacteraceae bacterium]|nr:hypothetical protein [Solirubrobacteraceae bacterium]
MKIKYSISQLLDGLLDCDLRPGQAVSISKFSILDLLSGSEEVLDGLVVKHFGEIATFSVLRVERLGYQQPAALGELFHTLGSIGRGKPQPNGVTKSQDHDQSEETRLKSDPAISLSHKNGQPDVERQ